MSKRWLFAALIIVILSIVLSVTLTGCQQTKEPIIETRKSMTLLHYFSGVFSGGIDALVGGFNQEQDIYQLEAIPIDHEAFKTSVIKGLEENNPPELYSYWAGAKTVAVKDKLQPLDSIWASENLEKRFSPSIISSASKIDGHYYLLPITQHYVTLFYNKKVFETLKIEIPKTWPEFLSACQTIKEAGVTPIGLGSKSKWPAQFWFDYILLRTAGYEKREALMSGELAYDSPEVILAFEKWQDLITKGYFNTMPNETEWNEVPLEGLESGDIAMTLMGTWMISTLESQSNLVAGKDFGYFDFPIIDLTIEKTALGPIDGIVVPKESVNPEGALEAIAYLARLESQKSMALGSGALSPSLEVPSNTYGVLQQDILKSIKNQKFWAFNYDLATLPEVADLGLQLFSEFLEFPEAYQALLTEMAQKSAPLLK